MQTNYKAVLKAALLVAALLLSGAAASYGQQVNLTAGPTSITLPDGTVVPMWGYTCDATQPSGTLATCARLNPLAPLATATTPAGWSPVVITVPTGQNLLISLTNNLSFTTGTGSNSVPTSLVIVGQLGGGLGSAATSTTSPDHTNAQAATTWPIAGGAGASAPAQLPRVQSFSTEVATGGTTLLTWTAPRPGTYLLESGTHPSIQGPMGLYGIVVVTTAPVVANPSAVPAVAGAPGTAYPGVNYNAEVPLLFSEIDPVQNNAVNTAVSTSGFVEAATVPVNVTTSANVHQCFDPATNGSASACYPPAVNYSPLYYLINGVAFDKTHPLTSVFPTAPVGTTAAAISGNVLVRLVNAGLRMHVPSIVGAQTGTAAAPGFGLIAEDGNPLPGVTRVQSEVFMAAGKTYDVMINVPTSATARALPVYDRELSLSGNATARDAGMLAYISVNGAAAPAAPALIPAVARNDAYGSLSPGQTLSVSDPSRGVIANDTNVYGVQLLAPSAHGTVTLNVDGTFTYVPTGTGTSDSFTYCANGSVSATGCSSGLTATVTLSAAPVGATPHAGDDTYTSKIATYINIPAPGVLANDADPTGYPLKVHSPTTLSTGCGGSLVIEPNGGFIASGTAGGSCVFSYQAENSQGTVSNTATVTVNFPTPSNLSVKVLDGQKYQACAGVSTCIAGLSPISDYRWIIEEDRTFYIDPNCTTNPTNINPLPAGCPSPAAGQTVPTFGVNFHTSFMPMVAQGCTGPNSCEAGQTLLGSPVVCDVGNGACRPDTTGNGSTPVLPSQVQLDRTKRYYISVLPGDAADPFNTGNASGGHTMGGAQIAFACNPVVTPVATNCTTPFAPVTVLVQPSPLPPSKVSVVVFEDDYPLNGEQDAGGGIDVLSPREAGLGGFNIILFDDAGGTGDATGQMTYDMFNMPLSNGLAGTIDPSTGFDACPLSASARQVAGSPASPTGITGTIVTCPKYESDGKTLSPIAGQAVVANLMPGRYGIVATPGADRIARGEEWLQTNTLDGQKAHDSFLRIGEPAYFQEFGPAGYHVAIGFANPKIINDRYAAVCAGAFGTVGACNNKITGTVTGVRMSRTPDERLYSSGSRDNFSFTQCYVSLGDPDEEDFMFTKCNADGTFSFSNVPGGEWRLTIFDQWNDQIVDGLSTPANVTGGTTLNMGNIGVQQWQSNIYTQSFFDQDYTGVYGSGNNTSGLALVPTNIRFRDGSFSNFNNTDLAGSAGFNEVFPLFNWYVIESDSTRYKNTGTHVVYDAGGPADGSKSCGTVAAGNACGSTGVSTWPFNFLANTYERAPLPGNLSVPGAVYCATADCAGASIAGGPVASSTTTNSTGRIDPPWVVSEGWQGFTGQNSFLEFGKRPFAVGETGGIRGHVVYASTRPFDDPQLLLQTSWEPLVPGVTINLYQEGMAPDGNTSLRLIDTTKTSSWDEWAQGFRSDGMPNMNCPGQLPAPTSTTLGDLFFYTLQNQPQYLDLYNSEHGGATMTSLPNQSQYKCYDGMHNWNQLQPAPYDGMYQFPSVAGLNPTTGRPVAGTGTTSTFLTNCHMNTTAEPWGCVPNPTHATVANGLTAANDPSYDPYRAGLPMLPPGKYVVEIVVPPGYELVKEEDKNILIGDNFIAPVTQQFGGLSNIFIIPDQAEVGSLYNPNNAQNPTRTLGATPRHEGDTGSVESFWNCVGQSRIVPDFISLFPQSGEVSPFAGATRNLCDRKEVTLEDQSSALAKFYIFTSTHVAAHFTGVITDDFTSEFDPFAPAFGEKFAPPNLPISIKDFTGNEIARTYSDHFGAFDGLNYSTWEVNPPNPTGYSPTMMVTCMNDEGLHPNPKDATQLIPDPLYNPAYSQFCYEIPFMPGQTQYMDTPVVPTEAFAGAYNFPDCQYPDATPAVRSVIGSDGIAGPWVSDSGTGHTLTITSLGDFTSTNGIGGVPNAGYSGPSATGVPYDYKTVTRHFGFGSQCTAIGGNCAAVSSVSIGVTPSGNPVAATINSWSDTKIVVTVPGIPAPTSTCPVQQQRQYGGPGALVVGVPVSTALCGELTITTGNGKQSVDTVTVTVGGKRPTVMTPGQTIQSAIDAAKPGDMIIVPPGTYTEMVIMWKPVRLQGVGAASSVINASTHPAGKYLEPWRQRVNCLFGLALNGAPYSSSNPYDPTGKVGCPGTGWFGFKGQPNVPQVDRLPLEAVVGWDASLNGNLAELLQEPTLMGAYEGAGITVLAKGLDFHGANPWSDGTEAGAFPAGTTLLQTTLGIFGNNAHCFDSTNPFPSNFFCNPSSIDGLSVTNSSQGGGGIFVHGWAHNLQIANNRVYNNTGTLSGGISVGQGEFAPAYIVGSATNAAPGSCRVAAVGAQQPYCLDLNVNVHNNAITGNSEIGDELFSATLAGAGGATFCTGADFYKFNYNWVCGNVSSGEGGGVTHLGFIYDGAIEHNSIIFNQSTNPTIPTNGGGLMVQGTPDTDPVCGSIPDADCPPGLSDGTGPGLVINANLIQGNSADSGSGGGVRMQSVNGTEISGRAIGSSANPGNCTTQLNCRWYLVTFTNNMIVNNVAGWDGAGVSLQDALVVNMANNTIAHNDSTASSGVLVNTLGAPLASAPAGSCAQGGPSGPLTASCPQPSGLVSLRNTTNLTTTFTTLTITCPPGYYTPTTSATNGTCRRVSYPQMYADIFWQNRSFQVGVGPFGPGYTSQQKTVALYNPTSTFSRTSVGPQVASQATTGSCTDSGSQYWDIGVRGDTSPTNHTGGATLAPIYSVLTSTAGGYGSASWHNSTSNPAVVAQYCNGSRVPPEAKCQSATGLTVACGWQVPPGIADAVVPNPVFNLTPAATVDEGNNWINMTWGPLSLTNSGVTGADGNYGGGPSLGNYTPTSGSPAINLIPCNPGSSQANGCIVSIGLSGVTTFTLPKTDFFGNNRPDAGGAPQRTDVGAVEVPNH
jgi:hypothetical protein